MKLSELCQALAALLLFLAITSGAVQADEIDDYLRKHMKDNKIPGLQVAVIRDSKIIKSASYGIANLQDNIAVTDDTVFTINSMTKEFTAVAAMQLVEQGKLDLSAKLSTYLSELPKAWQSITVKQLLTHTAGLPRIMNRQFKLISLDGDEAAWQQVQKLPVEFAPGSRFGYNQTNYVVLDKIMQKVSGLSVQVLITKQFEQVGMKRTQAAGFAHFESVVLQQARGYTYMFGGKLQTLLTQMPPIIRAGVGMSANATELARWIIALQSGQLLKQPASLKTLFTPAVLNDNKPPRGNPFALGWYVKQRPEYPVVLGTGGGRAAMALYPNKNLAIVVTTNLAGSSPQNFVDEIAGFYYPAMKAANGFGLPPAIKALWQVLETTGYEHAEKEAKKLQKIQQLTFIEAQLNNWGYRLMGQKKIAKALEIFRLNTQLYPKSGNTFDSLAETYGAMGNTDKAIFYYQKVLELLPDNKHAKAQIEKLKLK
ncbi:MAG: serine hydrolase [Algicola sp.]|nr:serine hydrolase [Algicola sp.]